MSGKPMTEVDIEHVIMKAINKVGGSRGASLDDIERYLKSTVKNVPDLENIQLSLNNAVFKGLLLQLDNGKYKIKGSAERDEATVKGANKDDKVQSKLRDEENEIKIERRVKENAQEVESSVDKAALDANRNTDPATGYVGFLVAQEEHLSVPDVDDKNDKQKVKRQKQTERTEAIEQDPKMDDQLQSELQNEDNEIKIVRKIKAAQEADRSVDKVAQDANRNTDSDIKNIRLSVAKEEVLNAPPPDDGDKNDKKEMKKNLTKDK